MKSLMMPLLLFFCFKSISQEVKRIKFTTINQVGLLNGSKGDAFIIQSINGVKKNRWFTGAGIGLDYYRYRTVPLFLDIRRDMTSKRNKPFAYVDAGINFLWLNSAQKEEKRFFSSSPGLFYDIGLGLSFSGKNNKGFILSAGYSFKQVKEKIPYGWRAPTPELGAENYVRYNYLYRRVVIKMGFEL